MTEVPRTSFEVIGLFVCLFVWTEKRFPIWGTAQSPHRLLDNHSIMRKGPPRKVVSGTQRKELQMWADAAQLLLLSTQSPYHRVTASYAYHLDPSSGHDPSRLTIPPSLELGLDFSFCFPNSETEFPWKDATLSGQSKIYYSRGTKGTW